MIRTARLADLPRILDIYAHARRFMAETGNAVQWGDSYSPESVVRADISSGGLYVVEEDEGIHAVFFFRIAPDPSYAVIDGSWLSGTEYGVIHRVASDGTLHGVLSQIVAFCLQKTGHLRIDTHENNQIMQRQILKNGFSRRGIIHLADGTPRIAYERSTEKENSI